MRASLPLSASVLHSLSKSRRPGDNPSSDPYMVCECVRRASPMLHCSRSCCARPGPAPHWHAPLSEAELRARRPAQAVKLDKVSDMLKSVDLKSVDLAPKSARAVLSAIR